jgi:hypothetical protein
LSVSAGSSGSGSGLGLGSAAGSAMGLLPAEDPFNGLAAPRVALAQQTTLLEGHFKAQEVDGAILKASINAALAAYGKLDHDASTYSQRQSLGNALATIVANREQRHALIGVSGGRNALRSALNLIFREGVVLPSSRVSSKLRNILDQLTGKKSAHKKSSHRIV